MQKSSTSQNANYANELAHAMRINRLRFADMPKLVDKTDIQLWRDYQSDTGGNHSLISWAEYRAARR